MNILRGNVNSGERRSIQMSQFELIFFDCYGTLIDWELGMKNAFRSIAENRNISVDVDRMFERYYVIEVISIKDSMWNLTIPTTVKLFF